MIDDFVSTRAHEVQVRVPTADRRVVDANLTFFATTNALRALGEVILAAWRRTNHHDEPVRLGRQIQRRREGFRSGRRRANRRLDFGFIGMQLKAVITELNEVIDVDGMVTRHARAIDKTTVIAALIVQEPSRALLEYFRVMTRNITLGQPDSVLFRSPDRVIVSDELDDRRLPLIVLDRQLPHIRADHPRTEFRLRQRGFAIPCDFPLER